MVNFPPTSQEITQETVKIEKKKFSIKRFFALNWRIIVLLLLLISSIAFIVWSNSQVEENFTDTFQE